MTRRRTAVHTKACDASASVTETATVLAECAPVAQLDRSNPRPIWKQRSFAVQFGLLSHLKEHNGILRDAP
jgi:hypothetical protein